MKEGDKIKIRHPDGKITDAQLCFVSGAYAADLAKAQQRLNTEELRQAVARSRRFPKVSVMEKLALCAMLEAAAKEIDYLRARLAVPGEGTET